MNRERVTKLRDALASGDWQKTIGRLHRVCSNAPRAPVGHCCQGVGCELALADIWRGFELTANDQHTIFNNDASVWPYSVRNYFGFTDGQERQLLRLNDDHPDDKWSHVIAFLDGLLSV